MNAAQVLRAARTAGIQIWVDGGSLALEAPAQPSPELLGLLSTHKPEILALLGDGSEGWSAEDWQTHFEERAAIAEFDGGLSRPQAERRAFACCSAEWRRRNPPSPTPGRCIHCGGTDRDGDPLLPFGPNVLGYVDVHDLCWDDWNKCRNEQAARALAALGIIAAKKSPNDFGKKGAA